MLNEIVESIKSLFCKSNKTDVNDGLEMRSSLQDAIDELKSENKYLNRRIESLEKKLSELQNKQTAQSAPDANINIHEESEQLIQKEETAITQNDATNEYSEDWIYFSTPDNGVFKVANCMDKSDPNICYRINRKNLAIEFIHSKIDSRLIGHRTEWLQPVCEILNNISSATSIKMENPGKVKKHGDDYIIDTNNKIKIKLL